MSIRSNARPAGRDLSPELRDILRRNGMQAHIIRQGEDYLLAVQGHDSPLLTYNISAGQMRSLTDWGANSANRKAYDTFTDVVKNDFYMPRNFVHARNANGRVAMGLHGYRIGVGEYGRQPRDRRHPMMTDPYHGRFLGWTPRNQPGFHMRRVGGAMFLQGAPLVAERPDGRVKPGELLNGGYGFYYKGGQDTTRQPTEDVLSGLETVITPLEVRPRPQEPAKPYKELITSDVYFSKDKWLECLSSHGIVIDATSKTLTIQSAATRQDLVYDLTDDELAKLTDNSIKNVPVQKRLDIINDIIKNDFEDKLTMDMLNSKEQINMRLTPEVEAELNGRQQAVIENAQAMAQGDKIAFDGQEQEDRSVAHVDGNILYKLNENKGWYREGRNGREVQVDDIKVEPVRDEKGEIRKDGKGENMYRMTAVINGESISHEITQKQYDKFMAVDDYHRMKLFSHIFNEVDMKNVPGQGRNIGAMIGGALLAGLTVMGELGRGRHAPAVFAEHHHSPGPHVYFKGGVDSPQELASRAFDAGINAAEHGVGMGHGR